MPCFMLVLRWLLKYKLLPMHSVSVLIVWCWCFFMCWCNALSDDDILHDDGSLTIRCIVWVWCNAGVDNWCTYMTSMHRMVSLHYRKPWRCINKYICWCIVWRWCNTRCHGDTFTDVLADVNVRDHDGGRPMEVNACILITHMVYL